VFSSRGNDKIIDFVNKNFFCNDDKILFFFVVFLENKFSLYFLAFYTWYFYHFIFDLFIIIFFLTLFFCNIFLVFFFFFEKKYYFLHFEYLSLYT